MYLQSLHFLVSTYMHVHSTWRKGKIAACKFFILCGSKVLVYVFHLLTKIEIQNTLLSALDARSFFINWYVKVSSCFWWIYNSVTMFSSLIEEWDPSAVARYPCILKVFVVANWWLWIPENFLVFDNMLHIT